MVSSLLVDITKRLSGDALFLERVSRNERAPTHSHTYRDLESMASGMAEVLAGMSVGEGDRVAIVTERDWIVFPLLIACASRGTMLIPLNPNMHVDELRGSLTHAKPKVVVTDLADRSMPKLGISAPILSSEEFVKRSKQVSIVERPSPSKTHPLLMLYTSGTTSNPKGVMLMEEALLDMAGRFCDTYGVTEKDRFHCVVPLYHLHALMFTGLVPLLRGASVVLDDVFTGVPGAYWEQLERHQVSVAAMVPNLMASLVRVSSEHPRQPPPTLRFAFSGAAPLPAATWKRFEELHGVPVHQGYGLTETTGWATFSPPGKAKKYGSVGVPQGCEIKIHPSKKVGEWLMFDRRQTLPTEDTSGPEARGSGAAAVEFGEIRIRGPLLMEGYFMNRLADQEAIDSEGFLRTGDIGFMDVDGHLQVCGRKKEAIIRPEGNILPDEIDEVLRQHPLVVACKTVGVPDRYSREKICSVIVPESVSETDVHAEDIQSWLAERISSYKVPDEVTTMNYLPRTALGKVSSAKLQGLLSGKISQAVVASLTRGQYRFCRSSSEDLQAIQGKIDSSLKTGKPLRLLCYWGCGNRSKINDVDRKTLDRLYAYARGLSVIPELSIETVLMTNQMHAAVNGRSRAHWESYFSQIAAYGDSLGFEIASQEDLWKRAGLEVEDVLEKAVGTGFDSEWAQCPIQDQLVRQADRHATKASKEDGARIYYYTCLREAKAVEDEYPDSIFITFSPPSLNPCQPKLPLIHLYSYKKGAAEKPWFMD